MQLVYRVDLNLFCVLVLGLLMTSRFRRDERRFLEYRLFVTAIVVISGLLVSDAATLCLDGRPGRLATLGLIVFNVIYFALHTLAPYLWLMYTDLQIFQDEEHTRRLFLPALPPALICSIMAILTPFTGSLFTVTDGFYHRGALMYPFIACNFLYLIASLALTLRYRRRLGSRAFWSLVTFSLPPGIGGALQTMFYGLSLIWPGATLSLISVFVNVQNTRLNTDYLTGAYNRMQADQYLRQRIKDSRARGAFSGIMVDINDFKAINDRYGHAAGDAALQTVAELLRKAVRKNDFVARFGGDEFIIILEIQTQEDLTRSVARIREAVQVHNAAHPDQFALDFSFGHDVYDPRQGMTDSEFLKHIDALLYKDKAGKQLVSAE